MRDKVKRFISILMTALMLVNLMPVGALADGITSIGYKPETVEDYDKTVYVYVKVTGNLNGLELNNHGWCTVGKVTGLDMPNPKSYNGKGHMSNVSGYSASSVGRGMYGFNPFDKNQSIDRSKVTWKGGDYGFVAVDTGADDYVGSGWTWHLDGYIDISQVQASYKIRYVDYDNKKIILQDNVESGRGKPGTLIKHTAPRTLDGGYEIFGDTEQTFKLGQIDNTFDIYYRRPYGYTVEYYYDGVKDEHATVTGESKLWCGTEINTYTPKLKNGYTFDKDNCPLTIGTDESKNVIKVYYKKIGYTVKYNPGEHGTFEAKEYNAKYGDNTPAFDGETTGEPGWTFAGWEPKVADKVTGNVTYTAKWEPDTKQKAEVIYITDGNGTLWGGPAIKKITQFVQIVTGKVVREDGSVIGDKLTTIPTYPKDGYEFDHWIRVTPEKTIEGAGSALTDEKARPLLNKADGLYQDTVFKAIFTKKTNLSYTVNYYWNGTTTKVADSKTVDKQTFDSTVTESPIGADGYTPVSTASKTITIGTDNNEITFYYYKNVELTANSKTETYDGTQKSVSGFAGAPEGVTFEGLTAPSATGTDAGTYPVKFEQDKTKPGYPLNKVDTTEKYIVTAANPGTLTITKRPVTLTSETASKEYDGTALEKPVVTVTGDGFVKGEVSDIKATGSVTYVSEGEVTNTITYTEGTNFKESNYNITKTEGKLSITPLGGVVVTIKGQTKTVTYDGEDHTAWKYDVIDISDPLYIKAPDEVPNFWNKNAKGARGTDAGTYAMGWEAADFENTNTNFSNVTFVVTDGSLTITKRAVTLTSASDSKVYDGNALTNGEVTVSGDGFAKDEGATYNVTGSQTNVGESDNTFTYTLNEGTKADNYDIKTENGTLTVTPVTDEVIVTITGKTKTVTYDGKEHSIFGYDVTVSNALYNPKKDMQFNGIDEDMTAKGTDAGTYPMGLEDSDFTNISDNFSKVTFKVTDGSLTITKRPVKLTSATDSKVYDGTALTKPEVAVGGDGFVDGEVTDIKATGSVTYVSEGEVTNTITYTEGEKFKADNYTIEKNEGKLSINPVTDKVTVTITEKSGTATYDGKEHIVSGYESMTADNPLYDEDSVEENPTVMWAAKGTNVGEYPVGIVAGDFKNTNANFTNVEFVVVDGALEITPAPVTLQAPIASKTYDGEPLKAEDYVHSYVEGVNFADDFAAVVLTGSQTLVGSSESQITEVVTKKDKNPKNYKFTFLPGTLTITDGTGDDPVKPENVVTKTHIPKDMGYNLGETVTFTVSVTNIYNEQKEVTLEEQPGVTFVDPQGAAIGTKATKTLEPGEKWTIQATYTITLDDILADGFTNKVKANFKGGKNWNAEDYVETRDPYIELDVTKTADVDKAALGQTITYTITVDYQSNVPGKKVEVKDPLTGLETSFTTEEALEGKTVTFTTTYTVTEQDVKNGIVKNTATVKSELDNEWMPADVETPTFAPITIKPKDVTATYNGAAITGKDVEITSGKLLEGHKLSAAVIGSGVNAGSYELTLDPEKIKIVDANNKDVSEMYARTILPGKLIINKRSVLITSQSATKTYDGSALTRPAVTITGDGFVPGELAKAEATGSITKVGSTPNAIQYTTTGAFNAANYSIALSVGTLTVTEKPKPEPRRTFNLTINYVYQNGKRAAASYNRGGLKNGETFDITSPIIAGYTASETVVSGTIYNRDIKVTVIYTADGVNLDDYGVPLGLGNITMNVGDCFE